MPGRKYFLDLTDLQFKRVRVHWKVKLIRFALFMVVSVGITIIYGSIFNSMFGSPKETLLNQQIENLRLQYSLAGRKMDNSLKVLADIEASDGECYRPVLDMDSIPASVRKMGTGGVKKYEEYEGFDNSPMMISFAKRLDDLKNRTNVQFESFKAVGERKDEWKREMEHLPMISPVNVVYRLGDGVKFREVHPVLGTPQWHHGQDICAPYGTEVYATGSGRVIRAGWEGGLGNCIVIDHGYGYQSTYGHLSSIKVSAGSDIKRGDLIGLTGSSGTSTGPHLHYQIDLFGKFKNPLYYFNNDLTESEYFEMIKTLTAQAKYR
jgi:hypothetical protein